MLVQVTAYVAMDRLVVQCTTAKTTENGRSWQHRILEQVELFHLSADDGWDLIWKVGEVLCERALTYGAAARADNDQVTPPR